MMRGGLYGLFLLPVLWGCVTASSSTGSAAGASARTEGQGSQQTGTSDTNRLAVKVTMDKVTGNPVFEATLDSGSNVTSATEQKQTAEAAAKASSEAVSKATASITNILLIVTALVGILFLMKMWQKGAPLLGKFIKPI